MGRNGKSEQHEESQSCKCLDIQIDVPRRCPVCTCRRKCVNNIPNTQSKNQEKQHSLQFLCTRRDQDMATTQFWEMQLWKPLTSKSQAAAVPCTWRNNILALTRASTMIINRNISILAPVGCSAAGQNSLITGRGGRELLRFCERRNEPWTDHMGINDWNYHISKASLLYFWLWAKNSC